VKSKLLVVMALALVLPVHVSAQHAPREYATGTLTVGGLGGAAVGMVAFGFVGALIGGNSCTDVGNPDSCRGFEGMLIGAAVGHTVGFPAGVHVANRRQGNFGPALLASAAIAAAGGGLVALKPTPQVMVGTAVTVQVAQLVTSIAIERATARRRHR
jgi:hypothetical protein